MAKRRMLAGVLVVLGVVWLLVNGPLEGPTLVTFDVKHGLTVADLLSLAAFALAARLWFVPVGAWPRR